MILEKNILINAKKQPISHLFKTLSNILEEQGTIINSVELVKALEDREKSGSTLFENNVAIPHASSTTIKKTTIFIVTSNEGITYNEGTANIICFILTPKIAASDHIKIMGKLSTILLDDEKREKILQATDKRTILNLFNTENTINQASRTKGLLIGVTGCAVGVAHTYIAAESLLKSAKNMGYEMIVETNGSIGVENSPSADQINEALGIIVASDKNVEMSRFNGKKLIKVGVKAAVNDPDALIKKVLDEKNTFSTTVKKNSEKEATGIYKHLMSGVSKMVPFVVIGGLLIAFSLAIGGEPTPDGLVIPEGSIWNQFLNVGVIGFTLMLPILAGYIAYSIGDVSALAPGAVGGWIANNGSFYDSEVGMGFIGAILAGFIAGYIVLYLRKIPWPNVIKALVPIMIIPVVTTIIISAIFIGVIGQPVASLLKSAYSMLENMSTGGWIAIGIVMGAMQGFDYGGALGKVVFLFSISMIGEGYPEFMGAQAMAIPVAPLGMGLATILDHKNKFFDEEDKANGVAALAMGMVGISEGAIPFAAKNPITVIPATVIGSIVACVLGFALGITNTVPHGGPIVLLLGVVNSPILGALCMLVGVITTAIFALLFSKIYMMRTSK